MSLTNWLIEIFLYQVFNSRKLRANAMIGYFKVSRIWLCNWWFEQLIDQLIQWLMDWLIDWFIGSFTDSVIDWFILCWYTKIYMLTPTFQCDIGFFYDEEGKQNWNKNKMYFVMKFCIIVFLTLLLMHIKLILTLINVE